MAMDFLSKMRGTIDSLWGGGAQQHSEQPMQPQQPPAQPPMQGGGMPQNEPWAQMGSEAGMYGGSVPPPMATPPTQPNLDPMGGLGNIIQQIQQAEQAKQILSWLMQMGGGQQTPMMPQQPAPQMPQNPLLGQ